MTVEFERIDEEIDVPRETGVEGFILALRTILRKPRVQSVGIDVRGRITVTRFVRAEEPQVEFAIDFSSVTPSAAVRSGEVLEVDVPAGEEPKTTVFRLFNEASRDQLYPVAFVVGANSSFYRWLDASAQVFGNNIFGQRVLKDRQIPDDVLILATSFGPRGELVDVQRCYKITLPLVPSPSAFLDVPAVTIEIGETTI